MRTEDRNLHPALPTQPDSAEEHLPRPRHRSRPLSVRGRWLPWGPFMMEMVRLNLTFGLWQVRVTQSPFSLVLICVGLALF